MVKGEDRASTSRVGKALLIPPPRLALEQEMLQLAGYPAGGIPSFGFTATFLIDPKVLEQEFVYTGGGSPYSLTRISVQEMVRVNQAIVARVRK
ncbi:YbaK/EbsC family protein [Paenibacillus alvei]|uniref:YbaK/EbsC family protein n=1 Tax=Paenibacillus alvei TaxID=44250 RepID=A0ABT4E414_PAEAL|nr:YbaK/EbsC family protein [Paenibacillus alvei]MCY9528491.1 YbaK/EbsC family protein [Paenibacillus alvei]